jgi:hypothetical protein
MMSKFPRPQQMPGVDPNAAYHAAMAARPSIQQQNDTNAAFTDAQDPSLRNWSTAHFGRVDASGSHGGRMPNDSPWAGYFDVLGDRGAQLNPHANVAEPGLPAGYTEGQLDTENAQALDGGPAPRWTQSENLPGSQQRIAGSLAGLQRSMRGR